MNKHTQTDAERNIDDIETALRGALCYGADPVDVAEAIIGGLNMERLNPQAQADLRVLLALAAKEQA